MVDGVDSQPLKTQRIQNLLRYANRRILHITKINRLRNRTLGSISLNYINVSIEQARSSTEDKSGFAALADRVVVNTTPW